MRSSKLRAQGMVKGMPAGLPPFAKRMPSSSFFATLHPPSWFFYSSVSPESCVLFYPVEVFGMTTKPPVFIAAQRKAFPLTTWGKAMWKIDIVENR